MRPAVTLEGLTPGPSIETRNKEAGPISGDPQRTNRTSFALSDHLLTAALTTNCCQLAFGLSVRS